MERDHPVPCRDVAATDSLDELAERVTQLERVVEQIAGAPVPQILEGVVDGLQHVPQERVPNSVGEQIWAVPVPQIWVSLGEGSFLVPRERVQNRTPEQVMDFPVPQIMEAFVDVVLYSPQEREQNPQEQIVGFPVPQIVQESVQNCTLEQVSVSPVPQTMEAVVEVFPPTPQERLQSRRQEQIMDFPVPQNTEDVAGVVRATPQERLQNRPRKLFVDVPVSHIMEQTAGRVMCTGKVLTVLHHRDDQARTVDTLGFNIKGLDMYNMPRSGDALHIEVPVPQIVEEIVERPEILERIIERFGLSISWEILDASLPPGLFLRLQRRAFEEEDEEEDGVVPELSASFRSP